MATTRIKGGATHSVTENMHKGLSRKSPPGVDASMKLPGKNIDKGACRGSVAPTPRTMGPRDA